MAQDARSQSQHQQSPGEPGNYSEQEIANAMAFKVEQDIRRNSLPKTEAEYAARNSQDFKLPEGVSFQFDERDPLLAQARKLALKHGLDQETFSSLLDLHVSSKIGELTNQATMKQRNLDALGAAGPARINAVAQWLKARAGNDGAQVAAFISQYPSAPIVRAFEQVIRQFSNQGGVDFSQSHRATPEDNSGKIAGYENMSFAQRRAAQMQQQFGPKRER